MRQRGMEKILHDFSVNPLRVTNTVVYYLCSHRATPDSESGRKDIEMELYHGTFARIDRFDITLCGANTIGNASSEALAESAKIGVWFASEATSFLSDTYPLIQAFSVEISNALPIPSLAELESLIEEIGSGVAVREWADSEGYDAIEVYRDEEVGCTSYIVWDTEAICPAL